MISDYKYKTGFLPCFLFTFIKKIENLDYIEAVKKLAERSGVNIPEGEYDDSYLKLKFYHC